MTTRRNFLMTFLTTAMVVSFTALSSAAPPEGKGGGKDKGDGGTTLPNVRYTADVILVSDVPDDQHVVAGMTNSGFVYGWLVNSSTSYRSATVYDQATDMLFELNQEVTLLDSVIAELGPGWRFRSAIGMNEAGMIVGNLENVSDNTLRRGFAIDTSLQGQFSPQVSDWTVHIAPDFGSDFTYASRVNNSGDILGIYRRPDGTRDGYLYNPWLDIAPVSLGIGNFNIHCDLNDAGEVAGVDDTTKSVFVYDALTSQMEYFFDAEYSSVSRLNDSGFFAGNAVLLSGQGKKQKRQPAAYRYSTAFEVLSTSNQISAEDMNESGDVAVTEAVRNGKFAAIFHRGAAEDTEDDQILHLDQLVADGDPIKDSFLAADELRLDAISDRDATGYGQAVCRLGFSQPDGSRIYTVVILTPFIPEP